MEHPRKSANGISAKVNHGRSGMPGGPNRSIPQRIQNTKKENEARVLAVLVVLDSGKATVKAAVRSSMRRSRSRGAGCV
jgi:hypothetical protein